MDADAAPLSRAQRLALTTASFLLLGVAAMSLGPTPWIACTRERAPSRTPTTIVPPRWLARQTTASRR